MGCEMGQCAALGALGRTCAVVVGWGEGGPPSGVDFDTGYLIAVLIYHFDMFEVRPRARANFLGKIRDIAGRITAHFFQIW